MRSIVVGTAGHIDHGKSALVYALTGTDPDRLKEEKARGITIDLGFAHAVIDGTNFAFVDVPGHERFVKNMLAGAGGIDLLVLVVAADESVMPQTREHFDICRLLRIPAGVIVLTKTDLASEDALAVARLEVQELVAGSMMESAPIVRVSAREGTGLDDLRHALVEVSARARPRPADALTRLPIDRVFSMKGFGTVVTGTLVSGRIAVDDQLAIVPGDLRVKVRGVQVHGQHRTDVRAGERCAVNVTGADARRRARAGAGLARGLCRDTRRRRLGRSAARGAAAAPRRARARPPGDRRNARAGRRHRRRSGDRARRPRLPAASPRIADGPGERRSVHPAGLLSSGDHCRRHRSRSVSAARSLRLAAAARADALAVETGGEEESQLQAAAVMIRDAGAAGFPIRSLVWRIGVPPDAVNARMRSLEQRGEAVMAEDVLVAPGVLAPLEASVLDALSAHHLSQPSSEGIGREELRARTFRRGHERVFNHALARLAARGTILLRDRIALAGHRPSSSDAELRDQLAIEAALRDAGLAPAELSAVAASLGVSIGAAEQAARVLQRRQAIVRIGTLWFHADILRQLKADVGAMKRAGVETRIDVAAFKERYGLTRKFAIPLLEYLDRERVTRRAGDARVVI
jgi:selenocysteine-specific elongation factor